MSLKITLQKNPLDQSSWMVKSPPAQWTVENGSELKLNGILTSKSLAGS